MAKLWKKGRGKLGFLLPLIGKWTAAANSPMGPLRCIRHFEEVGAYIKLDAVWSFGRAAVEPCEDAKTLKAKGYREIALIGAGDGGAVEFWSYTSDGKRSQGHVADVTDIHPEAVGFEAQMPAGLARMIYWPAEEGGFHFAVESKNARGWKRFLDHHYRANAEGKPGG